MEVNCTSLTFEQTGYFSSLVTDYLNASEKLKPFYKHRVNLEGISHSISERSLFPQQRDALARVLQEQYEDIPATTKVLTNIALLQDKNTFTVTTAHQPNLFTGPLYFLYKILHAIRLADYLKEQIPEYNFVPVYYMGSEDADLDEIGTFTVDSVKYTWNTKQAGAVGRMKVDKELLQLITNLQGQLGVSQWGKEIVTLFGKIYTPGKSIQQATLELTNELFGEYGLVVVIPDNAALKKLFHNVLKKELVEGFSYKAVSQTIAELERNYKVQAGGRELNLFYLVDDKRERIERVDNVYEIKALSIRFTQREMLQELDAHPERFSPNVILRGAFQETILPNIAFIGGGGELAYWLELKKVFEAVNIPYPVLVLRNSFLISGEDQKNKLEKTGISLHELFLSEHELMNLIVARNSSRKYALNGELEKVHELYNNISALAAQTDQTLKEHVTALKTKAVKRLQELEKKMLRAEKRKFEAEQRQLQKIRSILFPGNSLQERVENLAGFYTKYGKEFINILYRSSPPLDQQFIVLVIQE